MKKLNVFNDSIYQKVKKLHFSQLWGYRVNKIMKLAYTQVKSRHHVHGLTQNEGTMRNIQCKYQLKLHTH